MKKVHIYIAFIMIGALFFGGCSNEDVCDSGPMDVFSLEDLGCINTPFTVDVTTTNEFELIRNEVDFSKFISGPCMPFIDWSRYDLIAGKLPLSQGLSTIDRRLSMDCSKNQLVLSLTVSLNITQVAPLITFDAIIPKLKDDEIFYVNIDIVK